VRHAAALFALALLAGCGGAGTLDQKAFQKEAESIQSFAAEGALLAHDVADGRSTAPFTRVHASELHEQAAKLEETLSAANAEPALEDERAEAVELAGDVAASLDQLERSPGDAELARGAQRKLETAAKQAEDLAGA
jgi:hypothetical protein